ncbi:uncharacterized protein LOC111714313 isoform X3 [Eurytemora carolleeae]|uniref:uncharacterized protein LOC111714313 isoform X3 n=1 Tax=Eurytemora carolleeae TaxID=1294199 RepID=UPI000C7796F8|nr:uncharacterized protein LOC111714313 isoform X3 [Eurytemora carolleeae]|eukprot:XP_023345179.1 uncharacterized protein LOC111714313 isoform X3 [Eurytemora affinis]
MAAGSSRGNRGKKEGNPRFCFLLIAAFFLVLAAVLVLLVSNQLIGYTTQELPVGLLYNPETTLGTRYISAAGTAITDIEIAAGQAVLSPPGAIRLKLRSVNETDEDSFIRLHKTGVRLFLIDVISPELYRVTENCTDCILICDNLRPGRGEKSKAAVIKQSPNLNLLAEAYLTLINQSKPESEGVKVLPVMRDDQPASDLYDSFVQAVKSFNRISLLNPVVYTPSQYPKSDAFEIISSMGSLISLHPTAQVLMLSNDEIPELLSLSHVNQELKKRRWFAVDAVHLAEDIRASARGRSSGGLGSFTTLSYLGKGRNNGLRNQFLRRHLLTGDVDGNVYKEWMVYDNMIKIHRAYGDTLLEQQVYLIDVLNKEFEIKEQLEEQIDEEVEEREEEEEVEEEKREETGLKEENGDGKNKIEKDREGRNESEKDVGGRDEGVFISMFLMPDIKNVVLIPQVGWLIEGVLNATKVEDNNTIIKYSPVQTSVLSRRELEGLYEGKKSNCSDPIFSINIQPRVFVPDLVLNLTLSDIPDTLILPVQGGVGVHLHCNNDNIGYVCTHSKLDIV